MKVDNFVGLGRGLQSRPIRGEIDARDGTGMSDTLPRPTVLVASDGIQRVEMYRSIVPTHRNRLSIGTELHHTHRLVARRVHLVRVRG